MIFDSGRLEKRYDEGIKIGMEWNQKWGENPLDDCVIWIWKMIELGHDYISHITQQDICIYLTPTPIDV